MCNCNVSIILPFIPMHREKGRLYRGKLAHLLLAFPNPAIAGETKGANRPPSGL